MTLTPRPPDGLPDIIRVFGDPEQWIGHDGMLSPEWERKFITRVPLPEPLILTGTDLLVTQVTCHIKLQDLMEETLEMIDRAALWQKLGTYGGGFVFRHKRTAHTKLSLHAWGIAWDFAPETNLLGTPGTMDAGIVRIFKSYGFTWGGDFHVTKDPMHFQYASNY